MPDAVGVPDSKPVAALNVAHEGRFTTLNVSELPSASLATGWNAYAVPTVPVVAGLPEITGAIFVVELSWVGVVEATVIRNAGR